MSDPLDRVTELRRDIDRARGEVVRREALAEQAQSALDASLAQLKALGCDSPEEAQAEVERLREDVSGVVSEIETKLKEATS